MHLVHNIKQLYFIFCRFSTHCGRACSASIIIRSQVLGIDASSAPLWFRTVNCVTRETLQIPVVSCSGEHGWSFTAADRGQQLSSRNWLLLYPTSKGTFIREGLLCVITEKLPHIAAPLKFNIQARENEFHVMEWVSAYAYSIRADRD